MRRILPLLALFLLAAPGLAAPATDYINNGNAKLAKGDRDGAIEDYSKAIALKPDFAQAYDNRGAAKRIKGDPDGTAQDLESSHEWAPH